MAKLAADDADATGNERGSPIAALLVLLLVLPLTCGGDAGLDENANDDDDEIPVTPAAGGDNDVDGVVGDDGGNDEIDDVDA
jgi:hypothetical protein